MKPFYRPTFIHTSLLLSLILLLVLSACQPDSTASEHTPSIKTAALFTPTTQPKVPTNIPLTPTITRTSVPKPTATPLPSPTAKTETTPTSYGIVDILDSINPLTGLSYPIDSDTTLPPALVSISNSPVTTRPQRGLSYAPLVFEIYIGLGDTRFLALFQPATLNQLSAEHDGDAVMLGPVRSGRLPYNTLRQFYNAYTVIAGASDRVLKNLDYYSTAGDLRRVLLSDDGIVLTPYALKSMDMYNNGFSAVYDADTVAMTWTLDSYGRIVSLTTTDNVTIPVTWHSEEM